MRIVVISSENRRGKSYDNTHEVGEFCVCVCMCCVLQRCSTTGCHNWGAVELTSWKKEKIREKWDLRCPQGNENVCFVPGVHTSLNMSRHNAHCTHGSPAGTLSCSGTRSLGTGAVQRCRAGTILETSTPFFVEERGYKTERRRRLT